MRHPSCNIIRCLSDQFEFTIDCISGGGDACKIMFMQDDKKDEEVQFFFFSKLRKHWMAFNSFKCTSHINKTCSPWFSCTNQCMHAYIQFYIWVDQCAYPRPPKPDTTQDSCRHFHEDVRFPALSLFTEENNPEVYLAFDYSLAFQCNEKHPSNSERTRRKGPTCVWSTAANKTTFTYTSRARPKKIECGANAYTKRPAK